MTTAIPKSTIVNIATGEVTKVALSDEELSQREADLVEAAAEIAALEAKAAARQSALAKLAELGLTEEEIQAL
jgi:hypothetical protein